MAKKLPGIMLDFETLGTRADAVIISIGAVKFDPDSTAIDDKAFYASVSIDSNHDVAPRHISESTLLFWLAQAPEAQAVFHEAKVTLATALEDFVEWIDHPDYRLWSNGADFDIPMMNHALSVHGLTAPWKFYNTGCYRTMKNLPFGKTAAKPVNALKHNALQDAIYQARHLQNIFAAMKEGIPA
jgi:DNA polymerase III, alpha subunit (gram-positive type)